MKMEARGPEIEAIKPQWHQLYNHLAAWALHTKIHHGRESQGIVDISPLRAHARTRKVINGRPVKVSVDELHRVEGTEYRLSFRAPTKIRKGRLVGSWLSIRELADKKTLRKQMVATSREVNAQIDADPVLQARRDDQEQARQHLGRPSDNWLLEVYLKAAFDAFEKVEIKFFEYKDPELVAFKPESDELHRFKLSEEPEVVTWLSRQIDFAFNKVVKVIEPSAKATDQSAMLDEQ